MTIVTDPDDLDRFKVIVDPVGQIISLRGLSTVRDTIASDGDTDGSTTFTGVGFTAAGVAADDVLCIISDPAADGGIIGHYRVVSNDSDTALTVDRAIPASTAADLDFAIFQPGTVGNASPDVADGVTLQTVYSFLKEEWKALAAGLGNAEDLMQFTFPITAITREQMILGGVNGDASSAWAFADDNGTVAGSNLEGQTRELVRTGGWQEQSAAGVILQRYIGVVTLGTIDTDAQVYYQQGDETGTPTDFVLTGPVNQAVLTFGPDIGPDAGTGFVFAATTITRNDGGSWENDNFRVGDYIQIRSSEDDPANVGNFGPITAVATGTDTAITIASASFTVNAGDQTAIVQVDHRRFFELRVRKKARTYAQAGLTQIGVTTLEALVNRFPLSHAVDPAIVLQDGVMAGDGTTTGEIFQESESLRTAADGITESSPTADPTAFTFTSATGAFISTAARTIAIARPGDAIVISTGSDAGSYVVKAVTSGTELLLWKDALLTYTGGESTQSYDLRTPLIDVGATNATLTDATGVTGTLASVGSTFDANTAIGDRIVTAGDIVEVYAADATVIGYYKVISVTNATTLVLDTSDQVFAGEASQSYRIYRSGMFLQRFETIASISGASTLAFASAAPDTITRTGGSWTADGFTNGMAVVISDAEDAGNIPGNYIVDGTPTATVITLIAEETVVANADDTTASANGITTGDTGIVRTINAVDYPFHWRLFANNGDLSQIFQYLQWKLRLTSDIDGATTVARGDITDLLMTFASPNGVTLDLYPDDLSAVESNNVTFTDLTGDTRNNAFLVGLIFAINANLTGSTFKRLVAYFTSVPSGDFDTNNAIIVQDSTPTNMDFTDGTITGTSIQRSFDYTNNSQGGRTPDTDAAITVVAIGTDLAQYVLTTALITKVNSLTIAVGNALERNYANA